MDGKAFDGLARAFAVLLLCLPLGIWKAVEIVIWLVRHVRVGLR